MSEGKINVVTWWIVCRLNGDNAIEVIKRFDNESDALISMSLWQQSFILKIIA